MIRLVSDSCRSSSPVFLNTMFPKTKAYEVNHRNESCARIVKGLPNKVSKNGIYILVRFGSNMYIAEDSFDVSALYGWHKATVRNRKKNKANGNKCRERT